MIGLRRGMNDRLRRTGVLVAVLRIVLLSGTGSVRNASAGNSDATRYRVVLSGDYALDGSYAFGQG